MEWGRGWSGGDGVEEMEGRGWRRGNGGDLREGGEGGEGMEGRGGEGMEERGWRGGNGGEGGEGKEGRGGRGKRGEERRGVIKQDKNIRKKNEFCSIKVPLCFWPCHNIHLYRQSAESLIQILQVHVPCRS